MIPQYSSDIVLHAVLGPQDEFFDEGLKILYNSEFMVTAKADRMGYRLQGPHVLKTDPLLERFGHDLKGFRQSAEYHEGEARDMADVAYRLSPFPRIHLYYLLWMGDEEFRPRLTVLFDRSIENVLAADAIWALVNRVCMALLEGPAG